MRNPAWLLGIVILAAGQSVLWHGKRTASAEPPTVVREIYVPFDELHVLLENQPQRVLLGRQEYEELLRRARRTATATAPVAAALLSADYTVTLEEDRAVWSGLLEIEVLQAGLQALPLDLSQVGLRRAVLDSKPAPLGFGPEGQPLLFVEGRGMHRLELEMVSPVTATTAERVLRFRVPQAPAGRLRLVVPGDVEVRSGTAVASRHVDMAAGVTRFELLPRVGDMSLVISLNSRLRQQERVLLARSVLVDEITRSSERLHGTVSLAVLHRPVDRVQFVLPDGFEVTHVAGPQLLRWSVSGRGSGRILEVRLREETDQTVVLHLSALRAGPLPGEWSFPRLEPQRVASHTAVLGLLVEDRLEAAALDATALIPIDTAVLGRALPASTDHPQPGAPPLRLLAAYYAPQATFGLKGRFVLPPAEWSVQTNLLLTVEEQELRAQGGFLVVPRGEKLLGFDFSVPAGWEVTAVTDFGGQGLEYERSGRAEGPGRVRVRLPQGIAPGQEARVLFRARSVPQGWLDVWDSREVAFPKFRVQGAVRDVGAVAIAAGEDLAIRPADLERLTPLAESEKERYGLAGVAANLLYRYESPEYSARLWAERIRPRLSARTFVFARIEPDGLSVHGEIHYAAEEARARQLAFSLPEDTPEALSIQALDGTRLKQWHSRSEPGRRRWDVLLEEPRRGTIRLGIDFRQASAAGRASEGAARFALPWLQAEEAVYQSGFVAVEGNPEVDVHIDTSARRVDVGELVDALYQPGRRLLGVFGFAGPPLPVNVEARPRSALGLYPAVVQRAELTTHLSAEGVAQTQALFQLRTKATSLEVRLPEGSELWSALVDETPLKPQTQQGRLLVGLPASPADRLRKLQLVYQTPVAPVGWTGLIDLPAPSLALGAETAAGAVDVPLADLLWTVRLPSGYQMVRNLGTVSSDQDSEPPQLAAIEVLKGLAALPLVPWMGGRAAAPKHFAMAPSAAYESQEAPPPAAAGAFEASSAINGTTPLHGKARGELKDLGLAIEADSAPATPGLAGRRSLRDAKRSPEREQLFFDQDALAKGAALGEERGGAGMPGATMPGASPGQMPGVPGGAGYREIRGGETRGRFKAEVPKTEAVQPLSREAAQSGISKSEPPPAQPPTGAERASPPSQHRLRSQRHLPCRLPKRGRLGHRPRPFRSSGRPIGLALGWKG